jgi:hypothetical protein
MRDKRRHFKTLAELAEGFFTGAVLLYMMASIYFLYQLLYTLGF